MPCGLMMYFDVVCLVFFLFLFFFFRVSMGIINSEKVLTFQ